MFEFKIAAQGGPARVGMLTLPHGAVETPVFMPVGTQGSVRALSPNDLRSAGATLVLANTYHLHVRPGEQVVGALGGLHRFMAWDRPLLTDSGGFQVVSLEGFRRVDDDGVEFQSHVDGGRRTLTPERATEIQWALGADIAMAFDHVVRGGADGATARDALERTMRWLERCGRRHEELKASYDATSLRRKSSPGEDVQRSVVASCNQTLWPILQGGTHLELRTEGLRRILEPGTWTGLAIGGLSVGEPKAVMYDMLERLEPKLPAIPRYLMGVGFPEDLVAAVERGVDLFDCVAPTRNGRNGSAFTPDGPVNIRNAEHREDPRPLDATCDCETCTTFSRGYLRHLFMAEELLGLRLLSLHNVRYLIRLAGEMRAAIRGAPSAPGPRSGAAATCTRDPHDRARTVCSAVRSLRPECRRRNDRLPGPDRRPDRDLLLHADPPAAPAAGAAPPAARVAATRRSHRHLGGHHRRGRAPEGRRSHGEERRVALDRPALQHREHHEPFGRGRQAAVTIRQLHLLGSPVLLQRSTPVAAVDDAVRRLVDDLFETMHAAKGVGLAANPNGVAP